MTDACPTGKVRLVAGEKAVKSVPLEAVPVRVKVTVKADAVEPVRLTVKAPADPPSNAVGVLAAIVTTGVSSSIRVNTWADEELRKAPAGSLKLNITVSSVSATVSLSSGSEMNFTVSPGLKVSVPLSGL
jgi:hypothetical protein